MKVKLRKVEGTEIISHRRNYFIFQEEMTIQCILWTDSQFSECPHGVERQSVVKRNLSVIELAKKFFWYRKFS